MAGEARRTSGRARKDSFKAGASIKTEPSNVLDKKLEGQQPPRKRIKKIHAKPADGASSRHHMKATSIQGGEQPKLAKSEPLPLEKTTQESTTEHMLSLAESAVLKSSLNRSRDSWVIDGIFERCWTKPSKKKSAAENASSQSKSSMQKIGTGHLVVEPHVFDVTFYAIKENRVLVPEPSTGLSTSHQSGGFATSQLQAKPQIPQTNQQPIATSMAHTPQTQGPSPHNKADSTNANSSTQTTATSISSTSTHSLGHQPGPTTTGFTANPAPQPTSKPASDPVIQMLAQRASENAQLKQLMKTVASGSATPGQLRVFQSHIDDLSSILRRQDEAARLAASQNAQRIQQSPYRPQPNLVGATGAPPQPLKQVPPNHAQSVAPSQPSNTTEITAVAFEFGAVSSDRFLIPKQSIMEHIPGSICDARLSFISTRSSRTEDDGAKGEISVFYQPVTIRLATDQPKVLQTLFKTLEPEAQVQRAMERVMRKNILAGKARLALRLPRSSKGGDGENDKDTGTPSRIHEALTGTQNRRSQRAVQSSRSQKMANVVTSPVCEYCCARTHPSEDQEATVCETCLTLTREGKWPQTGRFNHVLALDEHSGAQNLAFSALV